MVLNMGKEVSTLKRMTVTELRKKHIEVFGEPTRCGHKDYLVKRIAWRIQAVAEGGLSERARLRAHELANDADLRTHPPRQALPAEGMPAGPTKTVTINLREHDPRLPMPGQVIARPRPYKGREIVVRVLPKGFEWEGTIYRTLTAVAEAVTGKHWNGYHFFQMPRNGSNR
jgi:hypothetical protein